MEENNKQNSRIFYLTLAVVLTVVSVIVIAVTVARRSSPNLDTNIGSSNIVGNGDTDADLEENNDLPTFILPMRECLIDVDFSDTVLVFSPTMKDYRTHTGIDIQGTLGQEVMAVADGVVKNIWQDPFMGTCVSVEHTGNAISYYKNLDPVVKEGLVIGAFVKAGDVIGAIGESAMNEVSQDPHLHFELKVDDKHVDPKDHLKIPAPQAPSEENK